MNSHLLANGAQQLLTIQPQLLALQQQQQQAHQTSADEHPFYHHQSHRKPLQSGHMDPPDSPTLRKDQIGISGGFKMRYRDMNKRTGRRSNGHGEIAHHSRGQLSPNIPVQGLQQR